MIGTTQKVKGGRILGALQYISVGMTLARLVMAIVATVLIARERLCGVVVLLILLIILFDIMDGIVYRKSGKPDTKLRRILDSTIDKASMFMIAIAVITKAYPLIIVVAMIMEISISVISIRAFNAAVLLKPNIFGKVACVLFAVLCMLALYGRRSILYFTLIAFLITSIISIILYLRQFKVLQKKDDS